MKRDYSDPLYKEWRKKIYSRDNHKCQWPGCDQTKKLQAHHIYRWVDFPGLRYHINNGITLCKNHHKLITNNEDDYRLFFSNLIIKNKKNGLLLIEVLVVLLIIIILVGLLAPVLSSARESARSLSCKNNLKQIGYGILSYELANSRFPPSSWTEPTRYHRSGKYIGWKSLLLPYIEETSSLIYDKNKHWWEKPNINHASRHIPIFLCPSAQRPTSLQVIPEKKPRPNILLSSELARCDYEAIMGVQPLSINRYLNEQFYNNSNRYSVMYRNSVIKSSQVTDGLSKTIILSECSSRPDVYRNFDYISGQINDQGAGWIDSEGSFSFDGSSEDGKNQGCGQNCFVSINSTNYNEIYSFHKNYSSFLFGDGGVIVLYESIDIRLISSLLTSNANENIVYERD